MTIIGHSKSYIISQLSSILTAKMGIALLVPFSRAESSGGFPESIPMDLLLRKRQGQQPKMPSDRFLMVDEGLRLSSGAFPVPLMRTLSLDSSLAASGHTQYLKIISDLVSLSNVWIVRLDFEASRADQTYITAG
jgi:hypothetical protein